MATFTVCLKDLLDGKLDNLTVLGLDKYPIYDEAYRKPLNEKIVNHFWFREIGTETADMFVFMLNRKMNEIMPFYNQLYKSSILEIDPLLTFRSTTEQTTEGTNESDSTDAQNSVSVSTVDGKGRAVASDTPQVQLSDNGDYATSISDNISTTTTDNTADATATSRATGASSGSMKASSEGFQGSMARLLLDYRDTFLNIDMEVIGQLDDLFMQVWDNGDEFSESYIAWPLFPFGRGF